ncbi:MAG TPA: beta-galactosidase, partial [Roseiflexaceae bacterium]|nr:beta-galactosidase [Roseiflexaceae bacterium]
MPTVELTRAGLRIDGVPRVLLAGQLHYFRFPRAEWRDLLLTARAAGLNTIDTVIPWNLHEPLQGVYSYYEEADLPAFLDLCGELGLWAIVRPGPYICAEWENGGFPAWLTALPGLELRVDNALFLKHTLRWFDQLMPLLAERQIDRGGPVILCQIENEHWASGRYGHDAHQDTLAAAALARGITVPQYTCMGAMRAWPEFRNGWSGIAEKLQQTRALWPDNPMIVSELWSGWFDNWGASRHNHKTAARLDLILHQLTAVGASGLSHWMWAGGTNFGFWGGRTVGGDTIHMTTSYDYDAPVSEYGGLTEKFFAARRHHLFLQTVGAALSAVLADGRPGGPRVIGPAAVAGRGEAGGAPYRQVQPAPNTPAEWAGFSATFLHNPGPEGQTYQLFAEQPVAHLAIEVEAGAIRPIFTNLPLGETGLRLALHTGRILGFWAGAEGDTLVLYGAPGEVGELRLAAEGAQLADALPANVEWGAGADGCDIRYWLTDTPTVVRLRAAGRTLAVVLLTAARAERWWPAGEAGFVCGPDLVIDDAARGGWNAARRGLLPFYRLAPDGRLHLLDLPVEETSAEPPVAAWVSQNAFHNSKRKTHHSELLWERHGTLHLELSEGWQPLERPAALEGLGCDQGYGWYRAEFELDAPGRLTLAAPQLNDRARVFLDGTDVGWLGVHPRGPRLTLDLDVSAGPHDLRLMVDNLGRFNYGANTGERKGLLDTLYLDARQEDLSAGWVALWQEAAFAGEAIAGARPAHLRPDAENVHLAHFAFQGPSVWLLREFAAEPGRAYRLRLTGDRNAGALFVNGVAVARFSRHNGGGFIDQDISGLLRPGANVIALNIQGYAG